MDTIDHWSREGRVRGVRVSWAEGAEWPLTEWPAPISRAIVKVNVHDALDEDRSAK
jgi:hypothetical protein